MAFVWQERAHDNHDIEAFADAGCRNALRGCGLLKFFLTPHLRAQPDLLEFLIRAWNPEDEKFIIRGHDIEFDPQDIYFLTGLSCWGERPIMEGQRPGGETLEMLMAQVCPQAHRLHSGKVSIPTMPDLILRAVLFMITWVAGSQAQHEASKNHLRLALDCLNPTIFNWAKAVTVSMKMQLTNCRQGRTKQFGYGSILLLLMFEQVPILQKQDMALDPPVPCQTRDTRWAHVMPRGGGGWPVSWGIYFREWLERQTVFMED